MPIRFISAKQGYKKAFYDISITNHDGARQAGNTTFSALAACNGATYQAVLNTLSPVVIRPGVTLQGHIVFELPLNLTAQS